MKERNENNSSKARTYLFFAVALLLMGAGLFGSFYTLTGGINTGKLVGSSQCSKWSFADSIKYCPKGGDLYGNGNWCNDIFQITASKSCKDGYKSEDICFKIYPASVKCPSGYDSFYDTPNVIKCKKCASYKTVTTKKKTTTPTTTAKRYYKTPTTTKAPLKNLQLTCKTKDGKVLKNNSSVYTETQIICKTDVAGATFKVTGFKKKTLSGNNKKRKFRYKKPKTSATIKVSKSGYKTNTISFKVLELQDLKLTCKQGNQTLKEGSTVTVYRPITCTVNTNGVRFKATGKKAVTLTESKKVYDFKYTKGKNSATIKASKDGYKTKTIKFKVTEDMKITSNNKKAFKIYCPTKVRVGDKFVCYVSEEYRGATITTKYNDEKEVAAVKNTKIL